MAIPGTHSNPCCSSEEPSTSKPYDNWQHRSAMMCCQSCMWWVIKYADGPTPAGIEPKGRCRRHAPTLGGWPVVFASDWCGDHKLG